MASQPVVVITPGQETEAPQQNEHGQSDELNRAERVGELIAEQRRLQDEVAQLRAELASGRMDREEMASLRSEVARLTSMLAEVEEEIEETEAPDVTLVTPIPEPVEPEPPPPPPKQSFMERLLGM